MILLLKQHEVHMNGSRVVVAESMAVIPWEQISGGEVLNESHPFSVRIRQKEAIHDGYRDPIQNRGLRILCFISKKMVTTWNLTERDAKTPGS